mmetsp:Transcript_36440/g.96958  ORF Transcript_36440/g.96958 Transcript_36440/m.96958 type:complete len:108 (-) Transcript_36440:35-358(-)
METTVASRMGRRSSKSSKSAGGRSTTKRLRIVVLEIGTVRSVMIYSLHGTCLVGGVAHRNPGISEGCLHGAEVSGTEETNTVIMWCFCDDSFIRPTTTIRGWMGLLD